MAACLLRSKVLELFDLREGKLYWRNPEARNVQAGDLAGRESKYGYRRVTFHGRTYQEHHLVWLIYTGELPKKLDHFNRIRSDNRIENLREASTCENNRNKSAHYNNASGFKGVSWRPERSRWRACLNRKDVGYFLSKEDAATAYNFEASRVHGEFAFYNTVPQPWLEQE